MKKIKKSGIILITTLIFMTLTFMLAVMICKNGKESLFAGNRYAENEQAYLAAISGIEFIKGELYGDKNWQVDTCYTTTSTANGLLIENNNNILTGYILTDPSGTVSQDNYDSKFEIFSQNNINRREYKTINNLEGSNEISPIQPNKPDESSNINGSKRTIPAKTFYAYVKGTCGKTVRYAEALFISNGPAALDGGNIINGKVNITSKPDENYSDDPFITINNVNNKKNGKITASDELIFSASNTSNPKMILNSKNNINIASNGATIGNFKREGINKPQLKTMNIINNSDHIIYNQNDLINKAVENLSYNNETTNATPLNSGTYVYVIEENKQENKIKKYWRYSSATETEDIEEQCKKNQLDKIPDSIKKSNNIKFNNRTVNVKGNVSCNGDLNLIVIEKKINWIGKCQKAKESKQDTIDFSIEREGTIATNGNLSVNGEITGTGKIYCGGDLRMNAGSELETMPLTGVAIYANGNIIIKEAQNLSTNSQDIEKDIIDKALEEAKDKGITLVSSISDSDDDTNDSNTITDSDSTTNYTATNTTSSTSDSVYTDIDEENNIIPTEVIINGHTYDVTSKIQNAKTQEDIDRNAIVIYCNYDEHNYRVDLKEDSISVYRDGVKSNYDITINEMKSQRDIHKHDLNSKINICSEDIETGGYPNDRILKIDGHKIGVIDFVNSQENINQNYSGSVIYKHKNGQYILSEKDRQKRQQTEFTDLSVVTAESISLTEYESTQDDTNNNNTTKEVTIQSYVEKYYKENVGKTSIRGSIYSKNGNINISGNGKNFDVVGALITANGDLTINNVSHVNLHYDPDYVPFFQEQGILTTTIFESIF